MKHSPLTLLENSGWLTALDKRFARFMGRLHGDPTPEVLWAAALVSRCTGMGHVCLDLRNPSGGLGWEGPLPASIASPQQWIGKLRKSAVVGHPGESRPLILDEAGRVYLYRYWEYQDRLAQALRSRVESPPAPYAVKDLRLRLDALFPPERGEVDWQKVAALCAVRKSFCVVSGGPGTGKTTTVARILALLLGEAGHGGLRMALAAPTGKAAGRLQEAIKAAKDRMDCPDAVKASIPQAASTIHRLLGTIPGKAAFRHNEKNPLSVDVVVVDEASMVDLPLMSKLVQALPAQARLILLGDRDQLSSVEAGAVLGDICGTGERIAYSPEFARACEEACGQGPDPSLVALGPGVKPRDCVIHLEKSYRFSGESGIALCSRHIRENDADGVLGVVKEGKFKDLQWTPTTSPGRLVDALKGEIVQGFGEYLREVQALGRRTRDDPDEGIGRVFERFEAFRILCTLNEGPCGVTGLNRMAEETLHRAGLLAQGGIWVPGRPILILRNDYNLRLFNGDVGIVLPDLGGESDLRVFFPGPDGRFRGLHPARLPEHETVFAMTVHKSQGSEFDEVLLVLPNRDSRVLTRELIYTAVTRAKKRVSVHGSEAVLRSALTRSMERLSGLSDALWK